MKISVIVPTYKPQAYLWECLDSIHNQTFPKTEFELVLVLNGCCDPYNEQIKDWIKAHSDLQIQYFQTDERGVSNARNIGLNAARGGICVLWMMMITFLVIICLSYTRVRQEV